MGTVTLVMDLQNDCAAPTSGRTAIAASSNE
jgi:hypothetical protein